MVHEDVSEDNAYPVEHMNGFHGTYAPEPEARFQTWKQTPPLGRQGTAIPAQPEIFLGWHRTHDRHPCQ